jgi:hypothetical protein
MYNFPIYILFSSNNKGPILKSTRICDDTVYFDLKNELRNNLV